MVRATRRLTCGGVRRTIRRVVNLGPRMRTGQSLVITLAIAAAACVSVTQRTAADYDRGSATEAKVTNDASVCEKEAEAHQKEFGYGPYDMTRGPYNRLYDACMRSHGYQLKPQQK